MQKAKKYDWKDSNMALFGSDTEKGVKKESAESEPAWQGAGGEVGLRIWRIVKFKVTDLPKEDYGQFFNGDSYIILNTYTIEGEDELQHDVHFWIGKYSTQDEYGTAAYKTVELDTFLDDKPIQHREVEGHESDLFKSYFDTIEILKGGADTGFRRVLPEVPIHRLLHFCGTRKSVEVKEVPLSQNRLNSDDVFILDLGNKIFQFNGTQANKDEKFKAAQYVQKLKSDRGGKCSAEVLEEGETSRSHVFFESLQQEDEADDEETLKEGKDLFCLTDSSGQTKFEPVKSSDISIGDFKSEDVFILDTRIILFVWVGKGASITERRNSLSYAGKYLKDTDYPYAAITVIPEGGFNKAFNIAISA